MRRSNYCVMRCMNHNSSIRGIYDKQIKYCVWVCDDKEQWIEDWQIEKKNGTVLK